MDVTKTLGRAWLANRDHLSVTGQTDIEMESCICVRYRRLDQIVDEAWSSVLLDIAN